MLSIEKDFEPILSYIANLKEGLETAKKQKQFPVSEKSQKAIQKLLNQNLELISIQKSIEKRIKSRFTESLDRYHDQLYDWKDENHRILVRLELMYIDESDKLKKNKNIRKRIKDISLAESEHIVQKFIDKQIVKIGSVLDKGGKYSIDVQIKADNSLVEGRVFVSYGKSKSFVTLTQMVFGYSELGREFVRYPTTFHDITIDGELVAKKQGWEWMMSKF